MLDIVFLLGDDLCECLWVCERGVLDIVFLLGGDICEFLGHL